MGLEVSDQLQDFLSEWMDGARRPPMVFWAPTPVRSVFGAKLHSGIFDITSGDR